MSRRIGPVAVVALLMWLASAAGAQTSLSAPDAASIRQSVLRLIDETNNDPMATLSEYVASAVIPPP